MVLFLLNRWVGEMRLTLPLFTGAKAAHVCRLLPKQTQVRIHRG